MKKLFYIIEFGLIFWGVAVFCLSYNSNSNILKGMTIPNFSQVKSSISIAPKPGEDSAIDPIKDPLAACHNLQLKPVGFPFVYKSDDTCERGPSYKVGVFLDYVVAFVIALIVTKITSMIVNRFTT